MAASASRIASLYVELGADSAKLETALKNAKLQLQNVGTQGKNSLSNLNDAFQQLTGVSLTTAGAIGIGVAAFKTIAAAKSAGTTANVIYESGTGKFWYNEDGDSALVGAMVFATAKGLSNEYLVQAGRLSL